MHKLAEKIADCLKAKIEGMGIDNISGQDLVELGMWTDIVKDMICYDKDKRIVEAMDEAEDSEEAMKYIEMYEDYPIHRKGYRGQPRDSRGRYMRKRMYTEPMYMMPDMDWDNAESYRDMDREKHNRMYYTDAMSGTPRHSDGTPHHSAGTPQHSESRYDRARRGYEESKMMHKDNSPESKQHKMKSLEDYMKSLADDVSDMINDMSPEEKSLMKQKMQGLIQKIG